MNTQQEPFNTGDSTLDEMLELKRSAAAEHDFDLNRIFDSLKTSQKSDPAKFAQLREMGRRKFRELQKLAHPAQS